MKKFIFSVLAFSLVLTASAQKYFTKDAKVAFDATSTTSPEKIAAVNPKGTLVIDMATGKMESAILVKGFHFEQALMEEHFNENYMESNKFAKATFAGDVVDYKKAINLTKDGDYTAVVKGKLTMHGVTKDVETKGTFTVKSGKLTAVKANFKAPLADYKIDIPSVVKDKITKDAKIDFSGTLQLLK
jgi:polyisoprenoid-binding protein YceI